MTDIPHTIRTESRKITVPKLAIDLSWIAPALVALTTTVSEAFALAYAPLFSARKHPQRPWAEEGENGRDPRW